MTHLESKGIKEISKQLNADSISSRIQDYALQSFQWNVSLSHGPENSVTECSGPSRSDSSFPERLHAIPLNSLLNAPDCTVETPNHQSLYPSRCSPHSTQGKSCWYRNNTPSETWIEMTVIRGSCLRRGGYSGIRT